MKPKELKYYGMHACLAISKQRREDIIRVYLEPDKVKIFGSLLNWCAQQKRAYHIIPSEELTKVSESVHHEGVCILARDLPFSTMEEFRQKIDRCGRKEIILFLDGVQNPHNLGSIIRTAAHFGVQYILGEEGKLPALSPSACRIAKGGAEIVRLVALKRPIETLQWLKKKGFSIIGTSADGKASLYESVLPDLVIFAIGAESDGLGASLRSVVQNQIRIPGSGFVESLNVSVATALFLGECRRQHL